MDKFKAIMISLLRSIAWIVMYALKRTFGTDGDSNTTTTSSKSRNYDGYYCKYCGSHESYGFLYKEIPCRHSPTGKHVEYADNSGNAKYVCKYCGYTEKDINHFFSDWTKCSNSPSGRHIPNDC